MRIDSKANSCIVIKSQISMNPITVLVAAAFCVLFVNPGSSALAKTISLDLEQALQLAIDNNHDIVVASHKLEEANFSEKSVRTNRLPRFKAKATYTRLNEKPYMDASAFGSIFDPLQAPFSDLVDNGYLDPATLAGLTGTDGPSKIYLGDDDNYNLNLSLQQPLFTGFAICNSVKISRYQTQSTELLQKRTEEIVRRQVTLAFWDLLSTRELIHVTKDAIKQLESHIEDLENFLSAGMIIENDLLRAKVALSNIRLQNVKVKNGIRLANAALCNLLVINQDTEIIPDEKINIDRAAFRSLDSLFETALQQRPDYKAMGINVSIMDKVTRISKSTYLPQIALVANYDWKRPNLKYEEEFYSSWNVNLVATIDVFNWGQRSFDIQKAKSQKRQLVEQRTQLADFITLEVRQAYFAIDEALQQIELADQVVTQASENYRVTSNNYQGGMKTNSDLLDAQTILTQAKIASLQARISLKKAQINLRTSVSENRK